MKIHSESYSEKFVRKMRPIRKRPDRGDRRGASPEPSATESRMTSPSRASSLRASSCPIATDGGPSGPPRVITRSAFGMYASSSETLRSDGGSIPFRTASVPSGVAADAATPLW